MPGKATSAKRREYQRFTLSQRIEHAVLMISFTVLAITGLPQRYVGHPIAERLIIWLGGIERTRQLHHAAAIVLGAVSAYHVIVAGYRYFVLGARPRIFPGLDDARYIFHELAYFLCLRRQRPLADRYTYREKLEYWAVVWGTFLMGLTGFMLWNPITVTRYLPGEIIPAAKAAHGLEAVLAVLSILTWHVYNVHLKHFNKSIFTGKMSEEELAHEHPLELERLRAGRVEERPPARVLRRRAALYVPIATLLLLFSVWGLYTFVTLEQTALTTIPRRTTITPYAPATPTPTPRPSAARIPDKPSHIIAGAFQSSNTGKEGHRTTSLSLRAGASERSHLLPEKSSSPAVK